MSETSPERPHSPLDDDFDYEEQIEAEVDARLAATPAADDAKAADESDERFAPFVRDDVPLTNPYEFFKTVLLAVMLLPFRLILMLWFTSIFLWIVFISTFGLRDLSQPLTGWRWFVLSDFRWMLSRFRHRLSFLDVAMTCFFNIACGFYRVKINGSNSMEGPQGKANVIVCNHSSYIDIYQLFHSVASMPAYVSKREVLSIPVFGWFSRIFQCIYVDRLKSPSDRTAAGVHSVSEKIAQRAKQLEFPPIVVFPEETTTNGKYLLRFRTGAFAGGHPVKPVCIKYHYEQYNPAWESVRFHVHLFRTLTQFANYVEVTYLPVYYPSEEEKRNPRLYADNVRRLMAQTLGSQLSDSTYRDKVEYLRISRERPKSN